MTAVSTRPRGCPRSPAGSAPGCRCPSSSRGALGVEAVADQGAENLSLDRDLAAGRDQIEHRALQHVGAGVDLAGHGVASLLGEGEHRVLVVVVDHAVGGGVFDLVEAERGAAAEDRVGRCSAVRSRSVRTSPLSAKKRSSCRSPSAFGGELDRARGAATVGLGHVGELDAGVFAVAQRVAQLVGQEAAGEHRLGHACEPATRSCRRGRADRPASAPASGRMGEGA